MRDERKPEEQVTGKPTEESPAMQEEQIEDLEAPAEKQTKVAGGQCRQSQPV